MCSCHLAHQTREVRREEATSTPARVGTAARRRRRAVQGRAAAARASHP